MNRITKFLTHAVLVCMFLCLSISAKSQYCQAPESAPYPAVPSCDSAGGEFIVRIYSHIVQRTNGTGGQSLSNINNALNILMDDFRPYDISFSLIGIDSIQVPDSIYNFSLGKDTVFQYNNHPDGIDIYFLGDTVYNNGVVNAIPGKNIALGGVIDGVPATDGSTLTHEMGHCLGLFHTYHGNCETGGTPDLIYTPNDDCIKGDFVKDTPPDTCISWRCTDSSCDYFYTDNDCIAVSSAYPTEPGDPLNISNVFSILSVNYMSGSPPHCRKEFTQGQVNRMKYLLTDTLLFLQNVLDDTLRIGFKFTATTPKKCYGPILIEPGGKLVVDTTFSIIEDEYIIVKAGGRLIVNGGTVKGCDDKYWHGIEVLGSETNSQLPLSHHGYARFTNGATIEKAKFPVRAYGGGLVIGIDSEFKNCGAAQFFAYNYKRLSYFSNFNFIADGNYGLSNFYTQAYLFETNNVAFYNCLFSAYLPPGFEASSNAIVSFDSKFKVTNSTIEGFHDGISAFYNGTSPFAATFSVERCTLKNNFNGISNWGVDNAIIRENTFTGIGNHPYYQTAPDTAHAGLVLNNCSGFVVEENSFTGSFTGATHTIGILAHNTGSHPNLIQINRFDSLNVAEQAEKVNRDLFTKIGLQYWCNDNLGANTYDFFVAQSGNIAASQGGGQGARNRFSLNGNNPASDFDNEGGDDILYYYRDTLSEKPDSILGIELELHEVGVICSGEGEEDPAPMPADTKDSLRQVFNDNKSLADSLQTVYAANLDGGDTEGLLSAVENVTQLTLGQVRQDLLAASPWVTAPVLQAVVNRQDVFPDATIYEVLSANPDEIRAPAMQSFLYSQLSQGLADSIAATADLTTARSDMVGQITSYSTEAFRAANRIIRDVLYDTLTYDVNSLRTWLRNKGTVESWRALAETYVAENDSLTAVTVLDSIPLLFELSPEDSIEHGYFRELKTIQLDIQSRQLSLLELDSITIGQIEGIAKSSQGLASAEAQGLLNVAYGYKYWLNPQLPSMGLDSRSAEAGSSRIAESFTPFVTAFPNPSKGAVTFRYKLPANSEEAMLFIFDMQGRLLYRKTLNTLAGDFVWQAEKGFGGICYFRFVTDGKILQTGKLAIIR